MDNPSSKIPSNEIEIRPPEIPSPSLPPPSYQPSLTALAALHLTPATRLSRLHVPGASEPRRLPERASELMDWYRPAGQRGQPGDSIFGE